MSNKNKNKGKSVEREVAAILIKATGENFQRIPNSGAAIGGTNVSRMEQMSPEQILLARGDIICGSSYKNLIIECKGRKKFEFHQLFDKSLEFESWCEQVLIDYYAKPEGMKVLIVFKVNQRGFYCALIPAQHESFYKLHQASSSFLTENCLRYVYKKEDKELVFVIFKFTEEFIKKYLCK